MATVVGTESEVDRIRRLVKMVETFIPTIDHCGLGVKFVGGPHIFMCHVYGGYGLYDRTADQDYIFKYKKEVAQKARTYLSKYEVEDVTISGLSLLKE